MNEALEGIAIVGMSGRFPGAADIAGFWSNLVRGVESVSRFADHELESAEARAQASDPAYVKARALLDGVEMFDADFFAFTPREAELMDPQHRLFLEHSWSALEDAGYDPGTYAGSIGVYGGQSLCTYLISNLCTDRGFAARLADAYQVGGYQVVLGNDEDYLATRVSYKLNLRGPSMTLQTACSTSLVAVCQACQSLLAYQCDMALAGGVSVTFPQRRGYLYQEGGIVSPDGHCRAFDAEAQGTVFGSGVGVVVLKRLADAVEDGDHVYAVIKGSALNNDGALKVGYMAPSIDRQAEVIAMAQAVAGISADTIGYVEAHGTATPLGDPIEIEGLTKAFRATTAATGFCAIGSVKTNIGHLEAASGVTGLIKTALALEHRLIPPSLHYRSPNPKIDFASSPFYVADRLTEWTATGAPRRAGVSSFGLGGTNAHVVVEEAPPAAATPSARACQLFIVSARSTVALDAAAARLAARLRSDPPIVPADAAYTLQVGRRHFPHRRAVVARDAARAAELLARHEPARPAVDGGRQVAFLFPGQGAQRLGMGKELYHAEAVFRNEVDACCEHLLPALGLDLRTLMFTGHGEDAEGRLGQTAITQPALFVIEYALARLWQEWGVEPEAMIGHSVGEYVAAALAGVFERDHALDLVAARGRLIQALPAGAMLAVRRGEAEVLGMLGTHLQLAAVNAPGLCVVSGPIAAVEQLEGLLAGRDIPCKRLRTSHAFHSAMMDPMLAEFEALVRRTPRAAPRRPFISGVTGTWITAAEAVEPAYWAQHARQAVRFAPGIAELGRQAQRVLLELGPGRTLTGLARQSLGASGHTVVAMLDEHPLGEHGAALDAIGQLWTAGVAIDWRAFHRQERRRRVSLPGYPFERKRHWVEAPGSGAAAAGAQPQAEGFFASPDPTVTTASEAVDSTMSMGSARRGPDSALSRRERLLVALRTLFGELSGSDHAQVDPEAGFLELGFDSLFLTQASQAIQARFKVKVAFRQLLDELSSLGRLASHLDQQLPPEAFPAPPTVTASALATGSEATLIERVMKQQLEVMAQQLAFLRGTPAGDGAPPQPPVPLAAPPSGAAAEFKAFGPYKPIQRGPSGGLSPRQQVAIDALIARYTARTAGSKRLTQQHRAHLADPRVAAGFRAQWKEMVYPLVANRSAGARLWDVDGNEYIDILNGFGANLFGHSPPFVTAAVQAQLLQGVEIGPQSPLAGEVAELICEFTGLERATFCNTGSEAVMAAMRLARTVTGRMTIVSFLGDYHGTFDEVLVRPAGPPTGSRSAPIAPGIPQGKVDNLVVLEYGSERALEWIRTHADELAAVLIEPVQSRHPDLQPREFLHEVRRITAASGAAMIMDEVITGFRVHPGGAQAVFGVEADLATYGKVIGGGMPIGVLAGSARFMDALDGGAWRYGDGSFPEVGVTFFAGTFVRHPLALAAARASLLHLKERGPALQQEVNLRTERLVAALNRLFAELRVPSRVERFGSVFYFSFAPEHRLWSLLHYQLRLHGVHIWEGFPCFLTTAHTDADLALIEHAFAASIRALVDGGFGAAPEQAAQPEPATMTEPAGAADPVPATAGQEGAAAAPQRFPLTPPQRELWLTAQLAPSAAAAFNDAVSVHLRGALDRAALVRAVMDACARHPALRTTFSSDGEQQTVAPRLDLPVTELDLSALPAAEIERSWEAERARITAEPFDLERGPLAKAWLVRLAGDHHVLFLIAHHLAADGWSFAVLITEIGEAYAGLVGGVAPAWPEAVPYADYARWQGELATAPQHRADLEWWVARLSPPPEPVELPADRPLPPQRSFRAGTARLVLGKELVAAATRLGARHGCTLFATMLATYQALLQRLTGAGDLVVGIAMAGQMSIGADRMVGHCVHLLPVRLRLQPEQRFGELLAAVRQQLLEAHEHRDVTFGELVQRLGLGRDPERPPLVTALFNFDASGFKGVRFGELSTLVELNPKAQVLFALGFNLMQTDAGLVVDCNYDADLFDHGSAQQLLERFRTLLASAITDPERTVAGLPLMDDAERERVVTEFNATAADYPREAGIHELFAEVVERTPSAVAVRWDGGALTYRELDRRAELLAGRLRAGGAGPGARVALLLDRSAELVAAILAVLKVGGTYVPIDPAYPMERIALLLAETRPAALVSERHLAAKAGDRAASALLIDGRAGAVKSAAPARCGGDHPAYMMFTSGSTGRPKGVLVPHRGVVRLVRGTGYARFGAGDVHLLYSSIAFDATTFELWAPLLNGGCVAVLPPGRTSLDDLSAAIDRFGVTTLWLTAGLFHVVVDERIGMLRPLHQLITGGDVLSPPHARRVLGELPMVALINAYGPTECTTFSTCHRVAAVAEGQPLPIGRPIANSSAYVLDAQLQPLPIGIPGELYLGGDGVALGYFERDDLTAERFVANPFGPGRLYRSGDRARWRADGTLDFLGRLDQQVKIRGFRVEPAEVESALAALPGVAQAAVVARTDRRGDRRLVAYAVPAAGIALAGQDLRRQLGERLPEHLLPAALVLLERLPLTANGKVDRAKLPEPVTSVATGDGAPRNQLERQLCALWQELLGVQTVGVHDNFFSLGGHSLLGMRLIGRIEREMGRRLPLAALFRYQTVADLAGSLSPGSEPTGKPSILLPLQINGHRQPFFCISGFLDIGRHVGGDQPFYGLDIPADLMNSLDRPTFAELAQQALAAMRTVQPTGPYLIGGHCFGAIVAFAVANHLQAAGEEVGLLALMDPPNPPQYEVRPQLADRLRFHVNNLLRRGPLAQMRYIGERLRNISKRMSESIDGEDADLYREFAPTVHDGKIVLFLAKDTFLSLRPEQDPRLMWRHWASQGVDSLEFPGDHVTFCREPLVRHMGAALRVCIDRAMSRGQPLRVLAETRGPATTEKAAP